jgi:glutathione S-transferase
VVYVSIVTSIMLIQLFAFALKAGMAREKDNVNAPAIAGNDHFERCFRVHYNSMELLIIAIPSMWMFANHVHTLVAAGLGFIYVIGRVIYAKAYVADPASRGLGFMVSMIPTVVLMLGALIGAIVSLVKTGQLI